MFSGIIERVGRVSGVASVESGRQLTIGTGYSDLSLGESVAVNGACLTVTRCEPAGEATFFVSAETLDRSNLGRLEPGGWVNLERSVTLATRLSGHLVQGHVDGKARLCAIERDGEARRIALELPKGLRSFCVEKGSIAVNGVSLTLNVVGEPDSSGRFTVGIMLIPHSWAHTNLSRCTPGDELNVEVDVIAKYVEQLCRGYSTPSSG
ncbi:MAG TPA: riboflavin synthase [Alphaproteobacteria bacterium]|nr:riboflavin synthase [Alphaproteobacteria bacterium]